MPFAPSRGARSRLRVSVFCTRRLYIHLAILVMVIFILAIIRLMTQVRVTFVHYHMDSDADVELVNLPSSFSAARGAYCLDGSPPAYYYRLSPAESVNFWIVYVPSGAWCVSVEDCYERSLTIRGSSRVAPKALSYDGILSKDCNKNPDFCLWNVLVLLYCDGGSFLGNVSDVLYHESQPVYLRGALVFDTLMEYVVANTGLGDAEQVVLAGSSAGGTAALIHADRLRSRLPQSVKTLHVLVDGAMFVDVPSIDGEHMMADTFQSVYKLHSLKFSASIRECTQVQKVEDEWKCLFPEVYHPFVFTPLFFINSVYDRWQRRFELNISCNAFACPSDHIRYVHNLKDAVLGLAKKITRSRKNGVFLTMCPLHVLLVKQCFSDPDLGNPTLQSSVASWLQHDTEQAHVKSLPDLETAIEVCQGTINC
ncbi:hypothetical protein BsWGS_28193 [Bradybaena similaris]